MQSSKTESLIVSGAYFGKVLLSASFTVSYTHLVADKIGYPVIVRPAFTLGGAGGGVAYSPDELRIIAKTGLDASPITQILVERYIYGWKELEFETMRDGAGNVIAVC